MHAAGGWEALAQLRDDRLGRDEAEPGSGDQRAARSGGFVVQAEERRHRDEIVGQIQIMTAR